jgi:hypothetical protein
LALFVRKPKERFLSAYLNKVISNFGQHIAKCCHAFLNTVPHQKDASPQNYNSLTDACTIKQAKKDISTFFSLIQSCPDDAHWLLQSQRLDQKYWEYLSNNNNNNNNNKCCLLETWRRENKRLEFYWTLLELGTTMTMDHRDGERLVKTISPQLTHLTRVKHQLPWYYHVILERQVDDYYRQDYKLSMLNLTNVPFHTLNHEYE